MYMFIYMYIYIYITNLSAAEQFIFIFCFFYICFSLFVCNKILAFHFFVIDIFEASVELWPQHELKVTHLCPI